MSDIEKIKANVFKAFRSDKHFYEYTEQDLIHKTIDHLAASYILVPRESVPEDLKKEIDCYDDPEDWIENVDFDPIVDAARLLVQEGE